MDSKNENINKREKPKVPIWEKMNLTIEEAAEYSNIGARKIREIADSSRCPFVLRVGTKRLVKRKEFEKYIASKIEL